MGGYNNSWLNININNSSNNNNNNNIRNIRNSINRDVRISIYINNINSNNNNNQLIRQAHGYAIPYLILILIIAIWLLLNTAMTNKKCEDNS